MQDTEVVISFDVTGSMYPCITQVRNVVKDMVSKLFQDNPNIRMGIIAHGDYCDGKKCITQLDLTNDQKEIERFVTTVERTHGGDAPECYELVLHQSRTFRWTAGTKKVLVLIGDDEPHGPRENPGKLDWRNELNCLLEAGIKVYAVQALDRSHATHFYREIAKITKGIHLTLDQFSELHYIISAVVYQQKSEEALNDFEKYVTKLSPSRNLLRQFDTLKGKKVDYSKEDEEDKEFAKASPKDNKLIRVPMGRFQVMEVTNDCRIDEFVKNNGLEFKKGKGFYQFTKSVLIQSYKEVIVREKKSGRFYTGDQARIIAGIPFGVDAQVRPEKLDKYNVFVQSTSLNRKLLKGSKFLYEVDMEK